ncbi:MAG: antibiotic biosynthesis monooxygenase family protein [Methyloligellaceae bacterium]
MKVIRYLGITLVVFFLLGCAPGHKLALKQLEADSPGPVLSLQGYVIKGEKHRNSLKKQWTTLSELMRQQPGFISSDLSPGIGESTLWLAHSEWSSLNDLKKAFSNPEVLELELKMPKRQFEHLFSQGAIGHFSAQ